jgi:hypothetical protein
MLGAEGLVWGWSGVTWWPGGLCNDFHGIYCHVLLKKESHSEKYIVR